MQESLEKLKIKTKQCQRLLDLKEELEKEFSSWKELFDDLKVIMSDLREAYAKNPTKEAKEALEDWEREEKDYLEVAREYEERFAKINQKIEDYVNNYLEQLKEYYENFDKFQTISDRMNEIEKKGKKLASKAEIGTNVISLNNMEGRKKKIYQYDAEEYLNLVEEKTALAKIVNKQSRTLFGDGGGLVLECELPVYYANNDDVVKETVIYDPVLDELKEELLLYKESKAKTEVGDIVFITSDALAKIGSLICEKHGITFEEYATDEKMNEINKFLLQNKMTRVVTSEKKLEEEIKDAILEYRDKTSIFSTIFLYDDELAEMVKGICLNESVDFADYYTAERREDLEAWCKANKIGVGPRNVCEPKFMLEGAIDNVIPNFDEEKFIESFKEMLDSLGYGDYSLKSLVVDVCVRLNVPNTYTNEVYDQMLMKLSDVLDEKKLNRTFDVANNTIVIQKTKDNVNNNEDLAYAKIKEITKTHLDDMPYMSNDFFKEIVNEVVKSYGIKPCFFKEYFLIEELRAEYGNWLVPKEEYDIKSKQWLNVYGKKNVFVTLKEKVSDWYQFSRLSSWISKLKKHYNNIYSNSIFAKLDNKIKDSKFTKKIVAGANKLNEQRKSLTEKVKESRFGEKVTDIIDKTKSKLTNGFSPKKRKINKPKFPKLKISKETFKKPLNAIIEKCKNIKDEKGWKKPLAWLKKHALYVIISIVLIGTTIIVGLISKWAVDNKSQDIPKDDDYSVSQPIEGEDLEKEHTKVEEQTNIQKPSNTTNDKLVINDVCHLEETPLEPVYIYTNMYDAASEQNGLSHYFVADEDRQITGICIRVNDELKMVYATEENYQEKVDALIASGGVIESYLCSVDGIYEGYYEADVLTLKR